MNKRLIFSFLLGGLIYSTISGQTLNGDLNNDGLVDVTDAALVVNTALGKTEAKTVYTAEDFINENKISGTYSINGEIFIYKDGKIIPSNNGHEYVDLGVTTEDGKRVCWAKCNVGAKDPTEYGDYYSWGSVSSLIDSYTVGDDRNISDIIWNVSSGYNESNYALSTLNHNTKYYMNGGLTELDDEDDVATAKWGTLWRMPRFSEAYALKKCYWEWRDGETSKYMGTSNIAGYVVYKRKDGDNITSESDFENKTEGIEYDENTDIHIFLPATGHFDGNNFVGYSSFPATKYGTNGWYWEKELRDNKCGGLLHFDNEDTFMHLSTGSQTNRYVGCTIRPVIVIE